MKTYEEYYQYYKNLLDKTMKPIQVNEMPEVHELGMALKDLVDIKIYNYYEDIKTKNFEKRMQELIIQWEYEKALREKQEAEDDDDILGILFAIGKIAAIAAVAYFAPAALTSAFPALFSTGSVANAIATGVSIGATDAAAQGVGIGLHLQRRFSLKEVLESTVSGGVNAAAANLGLSARAAVVAAAAVGTQGVEIAAGMRDHFDAKEVGMQVATLFIANGIRALQPQLQKLGEVGTQIVSKAANTALNAVLDSALTKTPVNIASVTASVIGNIAGEELGKFATDSITEERETKDVIKKRDQEKPKDSKTIKPNLEKMSLIDDNQPEGYSQKMTLIKNPPVDKFVQLMTQGRIDEAKKLAIENAKKESIPQIIDKASRGNENIKGMLEKAYEKTKNDYPSKGSLNQPQIKSDSLDDPKNSTTTVLKKILSGKIRGTPLTKEEAMQIAKEKFAEAADHVLRFSDNHPRTMGVVKGIGGGAEAAIGFGMEVGTSGVATVTAGVLVGDGIDKIGTGVRQAISGKSEKSHAEMVAEAIGGDSETAKNVQKALSATARLLK